MKSAFLAFIAFFMLTAGTTFAFGDEGGLYPSAPPPGSAFVRFLNGNDAAPVGVTMKGKTYGKIGFGNISAYAPTPKGDSEIQMGKSTITAQLEAGKHYTAALIKDKVWVLEEPGNDNKLKAQIVLINASSANAVSLKTVDGVTSVIDPVDSAKVGGRSVNALKSPFSVFASGKKIVEIAPQNLERGKRYAVVVYDGANGAPAAFFN